MPNVSTIPAGSRLLAEDLLEWETAIDSSFAGITAYKTADTSRNTTTTYATDPHLAVTVVANAVYSYHFHMTITAGATPQMKTRLTLPSGSLGAAAYHLSTAFGTPTNPTTTSEVSGISAAAGTPYAYHGTLVVGVTGGTFGLQWAQVVSNGTNITIHSGSRLTMIRMA